MQVPTLGPGELYEAIEDGENVTIIDVRGPGQYEEWHIDGGENVTTVNIPIASLQTSRVRSMLEDVPTDNRVVTVCASGNSSRAAAAHLDRYGIEAENLSYGMNGWAYLYEGVPLESDSDVEIIQYRRPSSGCLGYLVVAGDEAVVVDPLRAFTDRYQQDARERGATLEYAIDTHIHADHISGVRTLASTTDATAVVPVAAEERGVEYDIDYDTVSDGDVLEVGGTEVEVVHTPGHTSGMTSYQVGDVLFTGDGLFTESVARPDLEDGEDGAADAARLLYDTLQNTVLSLPDSTIVAPAHFSDSAEPAEDGTYTATLGDLRASMDALEMTEDEFVEFVLSDMPPRPSNYQQIIGTNLGVESPPERVALQLELGPNNCAASQDSMTS
jgi:glyoxylase-like metal-dependent hydrolase (beta-lactamase superfamily II)